MAKSKPKNWATGHWLIESMDQWDEDYINEEVEASSSLTPRPGAIPVRVRAW